MMKTFIFVLFLAASLIAFAALPAQVIAVAPRVQSAAITPLAQFEAPKIEYALPYPGILPDHPLYFLKQIRDRILDWLIVDPVKKTEFYILQADKRLSMGIVLTNDKKNILAETTISKGEKYMNNAVSAVTSFKADGKLITGNLIDRLDKSLAKHKEVLEELIAKESGAPKAGLTASLQLVVKLQQDIAKLK